MATMMTPQDELAALFDAYRPSASDADRQAFVDDLAAQLQRHAERRGDDPGDEHAMSLSALVDELAATPVSDASFDRLLVNTRKRFLEPDAG